MNISTLLEPTPRWFRRHLLVHCLLGVFPESHDQWIEFNDRAKAFVDLRDPEVRNVFLKRRFEPDYIKLASAILSGQNATSIETPIICCFICSRRIRY
jgi:hypothetical protein